MIKYFLNIIILFYLLSLIFSASISSCPYTVINDSILTQDISSSGATCITIGAHNIVLDCQGKNITGVGTNYGIYDVNYDNIVIKNCNIKNFNRGISLETGVNNATVMNIFAFSNTDVGLGIFSTNSNYINITSILNTNHGLYVSGDYNNLTDISVFSNTNGCIISGEWNNLNNMDVYDNSGDGIRIGTVNIKNVISNADIHDNNYGVRFSASSNNTITSSDIYNNTVYDIYFYTGIVVNATKNLLYGNYIGNSCKINVGGSWVNYLSNSNTGNDYGNDSCFSLNSGNCLESGDGLVCDYFKSSNPYVAPLPVTSRPRSIFPFSQYSTYLMVLIGLTLYLIL